MGIIEGRTELRYKEKSLDFLGRDTLDTLNLWQGGGKVRLSDVWGVGSGKNEKEHRERAGYLFSTMNWGIAAPVEEWGDAYLLKDIP